MFSGSSDPSAPSSPGRRRRRRRREEPSPEPSSSPALASSAGRCRRTGVAALSARSAGLVARRSLGLASPCSESLSPGLRRRRPPRRRRRRGPPSPPSRSRRVSESSWASSWASPSASLGRGRSRSRRASRRRRRRRRPRSLSALLPGDGLLGRRTSLAGTASRRRGLLGGVGALGAVGWLIAGVTSAVLSGAASSDLHGARPAGPGGGRDGRLGGLEEDGGGRRRRSLGRRGRRRPGSAATRLLGGGLLRRGLLGRSALRGGLLGRGRLGPGGLGGGCSAGVDGGLRRPRPSWRLPSSRGPSSAAVLAAAFLAAAFFAGAFLAGRVAAVVRGGRWWAVASSPTWELSGMCCSSARSLGLPGVSDAFHSGSQSGGRKAFVWRRHSPRGVTGEASRHLPRSLGLEPWGTQWRIAVTDLPGRVAVWRRTLLRCA